MLCGTIIQITIPAIWEVTKADGTLVDSGYYAIILNDKKLTSLTIVKQNHKKIYNTCLPTRERCMVNYSRFRRNIML